ncbi:hypothetical protein [uncultured Pseudacidovorax sp.]|uniref:hypothetical protein n=1 Tax=uncultured Pseudacidovorax sp. TaxID=679313 RepID=UPI0025E1105D|nr:hypothetical protein [uncultured Pseudacidovorax sp.]
MTLISLVHVAGGFVIVCEALAKLAHCRPVWEWPSCRAFGLCEGATAFAWILAGLGGAGAVFTPLMRWHGPDLGDAFIVAALALIIILARVRERPELEACP